MFDVFLDYIKRLLKSRLFPITVIYLVLFAVIIHRLFVLQIVEGPQIVEENELKDVVTRSIDATRGNIYDRNGELLASNVLTYSVIMEDSTKIVSNDQKNEVIFHLIQLIEENGNTLDTEFYIKKVGNEFEYTISGDTLKKFKLNAYAYVLGDKITEEEAENASAKEVYEFLRNGTGDAYTRMFGISDEYTEEETLKIMSVRYALFLNYPKYAQITIASNVGNATVAAVKESGAELPGVSVQQQTHRVYEDSIYFSQILGYTGLINAEELEEMNQASKYYDATDVIGKSGLEKVYEKELGGKKGSETVSINTAGKVVDVLSRTEPEAGGDLYLTIDKFLQRNAYHILEKEIAGILLEKIKPDLDYGSKGESASNITIPIFEVYYALINNNIIALDSLNDSTATELEKKIYHKYEDKREEVFSSLDKLLQSDNTVVNNKAGDMENYLNRFYSVVSENLLLKDNTNGSRDIAQSKDTNKNYDDTLADYNNNKISLSRFLRYALANNWMDLSKLGGGEDYYSAEEWYQKLVDYTKNILKSDDIFNKLIYRNLVFSYKLTGTEICLLLFDQGVLEYNEGDIAKLRNGSISAYNFMIKKIKALEITPAMLALEPCSGSLVITDVNSGNVLAMVTYPGYDNNKFAGKVEYNYFMKLSKDKSSPMINRPVSQRTAPGSTFKMVTSFAALEEGVVTSEEKILDLGIFDRISPAPKCHIYPSSHGLVDLADALKVSCNYFFYEMGWRLSIDAGKFSEQTGLAKLAQYATLFGMNEKSGVELDEASPRLSDEDSVRSAIGQGSGEFTPIQLSRYITTLANHGTCYDLTLIGKIVDKDGTQHLNKAKISHELSDIRESTWNTVLDGMYRVVNSPKGSVYNLYKNLGVTVAGKTGTSQISKVNPNNALFVSFAPYENPEISVTAVIPNGYTSSNAAELSKDIYKLYFKLDDAQKIIDGDVTLPEASSSSSVTE